MRTKTLTAMVLTFLVAGCGDIQGPVGETDVDLARGGNSGNGKWSTTSATDATVSDGAVTDGPVAYAGEVPPTTITQAADAPPLETYHTSFTAIQGQQTRFNVYYQSDNGGVNNWFMQIYIPWDAQLLNSLGEPAAPGEAVQITVDIDSSAFFVEFGPHGSTFVGQFPAELSFNLRHADLNGIDLTSLEIWYQPAEGELWTPEPTEVDSRKTWMKMYLKHFSNYAVAW